MSAIDDFPELKEALAAGVNGCTFSPLLDWDKAKLKRLLEQCDGYYERFSKEVDEACGKEAMRIENFFSKQRSKELDEAREHEHLWVVGMCSEIAVAALLVLGRW